METRYKVKITSIPVRFYRLGRKFSQIPVELEISEDEYARVKSEPNLSVELITESSDAKPEITWSKDALQGYIAVKTGADPDEKLTKIQLMEIIKGL